MSDYTALENKIKQYSAEVDKVVEEHFAGYPESRLKEAMLYTYRSGGKRIRPFLTMAVFDALRHHVDDLALLDVREAALKLAAAVELIHTYSLIHDDLPGMDNDETRRGLPSCHKVYGEALAILAGDALQAEAYMLVREADWAFEDSIIADLVENLAKTTGMDGLVGGQAMEFTDGAVSSEADYYSLINKKTGALIKLACRFGVFAAGYDFDFIDHDKEEEAEDKIPMSVDLYGEYIGKVFQIVDDILDEGEDKYTILNYHSKEQARAIAERDTSLAIATIDEIPHSGTLKKFAKYLLERTN